jgi:hypothetical protein
MCRSDAFQTPPAALERCQSVSGMIGLLIEELCRERQPSQNVLRAFRDDGDGLGSIAALSASSLVFIFLLAAFGF